MVNRGKWRTPRRRNRLSKFHQETNTTVINSDIASIAVANMDDSGQISGRHFHPQEITYSSQSSSSNPLPIDRQSFQPNHSINLHYSTTDSSHHARPNFMSSASSKYQPNIEDLCRLCGNMTRELEDIFRTVDVPRLAEIMMETLRIEIQENDGLPSGACENCADQLRGWIEFKEKYISTQEFLKDFKNNKVSYLGVYKIPLVQPLEPLVSSNNNFCEGNISFGETNFEASEVSHQNPQKGEPSKYVPMQGSTKSGATCIKEEFNNTDDEDNDAEDNNSEGSIKFQSSLDLREHSRDSHLPQHSYLDASDDSSLRQEFIANFGEVVYDPNQGIDNGGQIELYPGSNIYIDKITKESLLLNSKSPNNLARKLIGIVFGDDIINMTAKGHRSGRPAPEQILNAIEMFVSENFKTEQKDSITKIFNDMKRDRMKTYRRRLRKQCSMIII